MKGIDSHGSTVHKMNASMKNICAGGLETESEYPYKGDDEKCNFIKQDVRVYINGSLNISKDEEGWFCVCGLSDNCVSASEIRKSVFSIASCG
jgi:hypothetical protein